MNERGQVFTLDMFFALALTCLIVSSTGLAFEQAQRQAESYALRYSLERTANDAADVLVKTCGSPDNWWKDYATLRTLGLTEENEEYPILNAVDIRRFGDLRNLTKADNWDTSANASAAAVVKKLFGGSEKFQVRILDENENELWHAFPRWSTGSAGENSGAENSLDVTIVRRLVTVRCGSAIRADTGPIIKAAGGDNDWDNALEFEIYEGELDAFDFYFVVIELQSVSGNPNMKIYLNRAIGASSDYNFVNSTLEIFPNTDDSSLKFVHGGIENNTDPPGVIDPADQLHEGTNYISLKRTSNPGWIVRLYVVMLPSCSDWNDASMFITSLAATLEVKMWR